MTDALAFVVPTLVGLFGGIWLDRYFGTKPWLMLIGIVWGLATSMWAMIKAGRQKR
ncbi:MAG: AtpZ/AtpI family protein [Candidatus Sericytochromatia bacterium]|nr:AtpZ/AtpI family protein [Candidatus Sericytochromatia bacterium]